MSKSWIRLSASQPQSRTSKNNKSTNNMANATGSNSTMSFDVFHNVLVAVVELIRDRVQQSGPVSLTDLGTYLKKHVSNLKAIAGTKKVTKLFQKQPFASQVRKFFISALSIYLFIP